MGSHKSSPHKSKRSKDKEKGRKSRKHKSRRRDWSSESESENDVSARLLKARLAAQSVREVLVYNYDLKNDLRQVGSYEDAGGFFTELLADTPKMLSFCFADSFPIGRRERPLY